VLFTFAKEFSMKKFRENEKRHLRFNTRTTLQRPNTQNSKQIFPRKEQVRGYSPNSNIHVSVRDFYMIGLPNLLQENRRAERGNIRRSLTDA
jgi:hypothetical protein